MRRAALLVSLAALTVAGCAKEEEHTTSTTSPTTTTTETGGAKPPFVCQHKTPAQLGECVKQRQEYEGKPTRFGLVQSLSRSNPCIDISKWDLVPDFKRAKAAGLKCVIVQTNDGGYRNPLFGQQVAGIKAAGLPWGIYTFGEAYSGVSQAQVAVSMAADKGATLGAWSDVEVPGSYSYSCAYVYYVRSHGFPISGKYSAPGIYEGSPCGLDWPAEWGGGAAYPLHGYTQAQTVFRQYNGGGRWPGVATEVDLNEDLGLVALGSKAKPASRSDLVARIRTLHRVLAANGCNRRTRQHEPTGPVCKRWKREGDQRHRELGR